MTPRVFVWTSLYSVTIAGCISCEGLHISIYPYKTVCFTTMYMSTLCEYLNPVSFNVSCNLWPGDSTHSTINPLVHEMRYINCFIATYNVYRTLFLVLYFLGELSKLCTLWKSTMLHAKTAQRYSEGRKIGDDWNKNSNSKKNTDKTRSNFKTHNTPFEGSQQLLQDFSVSSEHGQTHGMTLGRCICDLSYSRGGSLPFLVES